MSSAELSDLATAAFKVLADNGDVIVLSHLSAAAGRAIGARRALARARGVLLVPQGRQGGG